MTEDEIKEICRKLVEEKSFEQKEIVLANLYLAIIFITYDIFIHEKKNIPTSYELFGKVSKNLFDVFSACIEYAEDGAE